MEIVLKPMKVSALVSDVQATVDGLVEKNANQFIVTTNLEIDLTSTDYIKLKQSLLNLLSNSSKFTSNGTVTLNTYNKAQKIRFEVSDTGIGIPKEKMESLFEEFTQADETTTREYGVTGLGLAITKRRFCELLQGDLKVESEVG